MRKNKCQLCTLISCGLIFFTVGMILCLFGSGILQKHLLSAVLLINGTKSFDNWMEPGLPVYMSVYVWHLKNPDQVVRRGQRPSLEQRGPYTYRQIRSKHDVQFLEDNTLLRFRKSKEFFFEPDLSVGPDTD